MNVENLHVVFLSFFFVKERYRIGRDISVGNPYSDIGTIAPIAPF
jgi:hypothetical protein